MEDADHPIWPRRALALVLVLRGGAKSPEDLLGPARRGRPDRTDTSHQAAALAWLENNRYVRFDAQLRLWRLTRAGQVWLDRLERAAS